MHVTLLILMKGAMFLFVEAALGLMTGFATLVATIISAILTLVLGNKNNRS